MKEKQLQSIFNIEEIFAEKWSIDNPIRTPDQFIDKEEMISILRKSAEDHLSKYPALIVVYGDYYKLKIGDKVYPANGGPGYLGIFRTLYSRPSEDNQFIGYFGDSFVLVVEMGEEIRAQGLLTYGNSSNLNSPHFGDQLELFSEKKLRDIWLRREDQEVNLLEIESIDDM